MPGRKHEQLGSILQTFQDLKLSTKVIKHLQTGTQLWWCHEAPRRHSVSRSFAPEASASGNAPPPEYTVKNMNIRPDVGVWQHQSVKLTFLSRSSMCSPLRTCPCFSLSTVFSDGGCDSTCTAEPHVSNRGIPAAPGPTQTAPIIANKAAINAAKGMNN